MKTGSIQTGSKSLSAWIVVLVVLVAGAAYAWTIQMIEGFSVTGLTAIMPWGLYVALFGFLLGIGGGALVVSGSMDLANMRWYPSISRISIVVGVVAAILGSVFILGDLGRPERAFNFFLSPNLESSMVWDMIFMILFLVSAVGYGWFSMRGDLVRKRSPLALGTRDLSQEALGRDRTMSKILAGVAVVTGALMAFQASLTSWTVAEHEVLESLSMRMLLAPLFISSALASGAAVLLLVIVVLSRFTGIKTELGTRESLAKMLAILVVLNLAIVLVETMILDYRGRVLYSVLVEGQYAPMLWSAVAVGAIVPLAMLTYPGTRRLGSMLAIASVLSLAGIFLIRLILLLQGTTYPHIAYPLGIPIQTVPQTTWLTVGSYVPTWVELTVSIGTLAFGALLFTIATKILPLNREVSA